MTCGYSHCQVSVAIQELQIHEEGATVLLRGEMETEKKLYNHIVLVTIMSIAIARLVYMRNVKSVYPAR